MAGKSRCRRIPRAPKPGIAEDSVRLREPRSAMHFEISSPPGVAEAIEALISSGAVTVIEDLEIDLGEATAHMVAVTANPDVVCS